MSEPRARAIDRALRFGLVAGPLVVLLAWCAVDRRAPNDHDLVYTEWAVRHAAGVADAPLTGFLAALRQVFDAGIRPPTTEVWLLAVMAAFGVTRFAFRAANALWLVGLVLGTERLGRELAGPGTGRLAAAVVATTPLMVQLSRKADPFFAAAALAPWALWLGLVALRRGGWAWAAFGAVEAARIYLHPVVLPDVVGALVLFALAGRRARSPGWWRGAAAAGFVLLPMVWGPTWSLPNYLAARAEFVDAGGLGGLRFAGLWVVELVAVHLFPVGAALIAVGALAGREVLATPGRRLVGLALLLQLPPAALALANGGLLPDFAHLLPPAIVLLLTPWASRAPRTRVAWATALLVHGAVVVAVPGVMAAGGRDPIDQPEAFDRPLLRAWGRSPTGRHHHTHHFAVRRPLAMDRLVTAVPGQGPLRLSIVDLVWNPGPRFGSGCSVEPADRARFALRTPAEPELSGWPALFAGRGPWQLETGTFGTVLVRLRAEPATGANGCIAVERAPPGLAQAAEAWLGQELPGATTAIPDPTQDFLGPRTEWERLPDGLGLGFLVVR